MLCPVHVFSRQQCTWRCASARAELKRLGNDYRQYWYDRRRGVKVMHLSEYRARYGMHDIEWPADEAMYARRS